VAAGLLGLSPEGFFFMLPTQFLLVILDIQLLHRTRLQKGWTSIATDDKVRVTKGRGKLFQLVLTSPLPFSRESLSLALELNGEVVESSRPSSRVQVSRISNVSERTENRQTRYTAEAIIKISALCDRLRVVVSVAMDPQRILSGKSVEFMTHDNGRVQKEAEQTPKPKSKGMKRGGNMSLLYNKLVVGQGMPESAPNPAVGDCSSRASCVGRASVVTDEEAQIHDFPPAAGTKQSTLQYGHCKESHF